MSSEDDPVKRDRPTRPADATGRRDRPTVEAAES
jgi:hypothetical protein